MLLATSLAAFSSKADADRPHNSHLCPPSAPSSLIFPIFSILSSSTLHPPSSLRSDFAAQSYTLHTTTTAHINLPQTDTRLVCIKSIHTVPFPLPLLPLSPVSRSSDRSASVSSIASVVLPCDSLWTVTVATTH